MPEAPMAYGLVFDSALDLPEFPVVEIGDREADVVISVGQVPAHLAEPDGVGVLFEAKHDEFLLKMPGVGRYLVRSGNEIVVEPSGEASEHEVRVFMLGSCIGALLHQRSVLVLHAAAMATEHGAVLFAGPSGAGKSTLLGAFLERGRPMLVDDVCAVVAAADGSPLVVPGYPRTRVWADSARRLGVATSSLTRTRPSLDKFERQLPDRFWSEPAPLARVYVLAPSNEKSIEITEPAPVEAFAAVLNNTYRRRFIAGLAMHESHFALASAVASAGLVRRVTRPLGSFDLDALADALESDVSRR